MRLPWVLEIPGHGKSGAGIPGKRWGAWRCQYQSGPDFAIIVNCFLNHVGYFK